MIVLGIDISKVSTGFFITDNNLQVIECGTIKNKTLLEQHNIIKELMIKHKVTDVAIEDTFFSRNAHTLKELMKVHGAILVAVEELKIKHKYISVMQAKSIALGRVKSKTEDGKRKTGKELKKEVQQAMFEVFGEFCSSKELDISDACSIAYAYMQR